MWQQVPHTVPAHPNILTFHTIHLIWGKFATLTSAFIFISSATRRTHTWLISLVLPMNTSSLHRRGPTEPTKKFTQAAESTETRQSVECPRFGQQLSQGDCRGEGRVGVGRATGVGARVVVPRGGGVLGLKVCFLQLHTGGTHTKRKKKWQWVVGTG